MFSALDLRPSKALMPKISFNVSAASLISYSPYFICFGNGFVIIQKHVELS